MSVEIERVESAEELQERVCSGRPNPIEADLVVHTRISGGILRFAGAAFPEHELQDIYAQKYERSEGFGAHFDVYSDYIQEPYIALYSLRGEASFRAARIPMSLTRQYYEDHETPSSEAHEARRSYAEIAFNRPNSHIVSGNFASGDGLIIPQVKFSDTAHEVTPISNDGEFIKLLAPKADEQSITVIGSAGFVPLDDLVTSALCKVSATAAPTSVTTGALEIPGSSALDGQPQEDQPTPRRTLRPRRSGSRGLLD